MKYFLKLNNPKSLPFWKDGDPILLPCERSVNNLDYSLIEKELPLDFVDRMRDCLLSRTPKSLILSNGDELEETPVGFTRMDITRNDITLLREADYFGD